MVLNHFVLLSGVCDSEFWVAVNRKAIMFLTATKSIHAIQDDGTVQPSFTQGQEQVHAQESVRPVKSIDMPPKHLRADLSRKGEDGSYTHSRAGSEVWFLYNEGRCKLPCPNKRMHQLDGTHGEPVSRVLAAAADACGSVEQILSRRCQREKSVFARHVPLAGRRFADGTWAFFGASAVYPPELNRSLAQAIANCRALSGQQTPKVLHIFGGCADRVDGLAAFLKDLGAAIVTVDVVNGADQDLLEDTMWQKLLE
eukprot:4508740-Amphidinium_carterae.1